MSRALSERLKWEKINGKLVEHWAKEHDFEEANLKPTSNPTSRLTLRQGRETDTCICTSSTEAPRDVCTATELNCEEINPSYLELMITVDSRVMKKFRFMDLEEFILTIVNMVNHFILAFTNEQLKF
jgi:hypothetical protein